MERTVEQTDRQTQYRHLRERLLQERTRLQEEADTLRQRVRDNGQDFSSATVRHGAYDAGDDSFATFEQEKTIALEQNIRGLLKAVHRALDKLDQGTYGVCEECGREIPLARLEAFPEATLCVEDQAKRERRRTRGL